MRLLIRERKAAKKNFSSQIIMLRYLNNSTYEAFTFAGHLQ
jgi:hypothetical protein